MASFSGCKSVLKTDHLLPTPELKKLDPEAVVVVYVRQEIEDIFSPITCNPPNLCGFVTGLAQKYLVTIKFLRP